MMQEIRLAIAARVLEVSRTKGVTGPGEASVEYRLVRNAKAAAVRSGRLSAEDVCDAHPELLRAARNIGRPTEDRCPVCDDAVTVEVTYVFGAKLPAGGTCPGPATDGQVLVFHDAMGLGAGTPPKFVRQYLVGATLLTGAVAACVADVRSGGFPGPAESYVTSEDLRSHLKG